MPNLIVLFNLKAGETAAAEYENWARTKDVPTVSALNSVDTFKIYRMGNLLGTTQKAPYQYCELLEINDMNQLFQEIGSETMQQIAAAFHQFADNPIFIVSEQFV